MCRSAGSTEPVSYTHLGVTIALETTLSEELLEEGFVREIISKVQTMRKENGYEVTDHIKVCLLYTSRCV